VWQQDNGVHPEASKSMLKADRPDRLNDFNYKNDGDKIASCCTAMGRKLLTLSGIADTYTSLMNTWNTLLESFQQRVYKNTLATVKHQIQQGENPMHAMVISVEAVRVDNAIFLEYLTSEVALEEPGIESTDPNIPIDNNCMDDKLNLGMLWGSGHYEDEDDKCNKCDGIPTTGWQRRPTTELESLDLGTSDVHRYQGEDGDDADVDDNDEALQAVDGLTQNVEN